MDDAIKVMPRTHHRLVLFKHRVITEAKLDKPTQFDMGKFRDESQTVLAQMWHRVAKHSKDKRHQMSAHVNSIEALTEIENLYQKVEYLAEFGEWLLVNEYPVSKAIDQLLYAVHLVLNGMPGCGPSLLIKQDAETVTSGELKIFDHLTDIKQLDWLARLYTMLAEMEQRNGHGYESYVLAATTLVHRTWKVRILNWVNLNMNYDLFRTSD